MPPKSSRGLTYFGQAYYLAGTQNTQHRLDWMFHCYCEVLEKKEEKKSLFWWCSFEHVLSIHQMCAAFTFPRWWQIGVCLGWQWHACRQVCLHASLHDVVSVLRVLSGDRDLLQVAHVQQHGSPERSATGTHYRYLPTYGRETGPESPGTAHRAFHLTGPDPCKQATPTPFCNSPFGCDIESVL